MLVAYYLYIFFDPFVLVCKLLQAFAVSIQADFIVCKSLLLVKSWASIKIKSQYCLHGALNLFSFWQNIGDGDIAEKPVDPIKVYSEKELLREFEKIASTLVPEKDWSLRIAALQRVEALVYGGMLSSEEVFFELYVSFVLWVFLFNITILECSVRCNGLSIISCAFEATSPTSMHSVVRS